MSLELQHVVVVESERMNLLGLMLAHLLERNLGRPELRGRAEALRGSVAVKVGEMGVTLAFEDGRVTISRGADPGARATVSGAMQDLLGLSLGGGMVGPWLSGKLRARGNLLMLLKLKPLLAAEPA